MRSRAAIICMQIAIFKSAWSEEQVVGFVNMIIVARHASASARYVMHVPNAVHNQIFWQYIVLVSIYQSNATLQLHLLHAQAQLGQFVCKC